MKLLTFYNPQTPLEVVTATENGTEKSDSIANNGSLAPQHLSAASSPSMSPAMSVCSSSSRPSSPSLDTVFTVARWMKSMRLHKYYDKINNFSLDQLLVVSDKQLEECGLTSGAMALFRRALVSLKPYITYDESGVAEVEATWGHPAVSVSCQTTSEPATACASQICVTSTTAAAGKCKQDSCKLDASTSCSDESCSPAASPHPGTSSSSPVPELSDSSNGRGPERRIPKFHSDRNKRSLSMRKFNNRQQTGPVPLSGMSEQQHNDTSQHSVMLQLRHPNVPPIYPMMAPPLPRAMHPSIRSPRAMLNGRAHEFIPQPHCLPINTRIPNGLHMANATHLTMQQPPPPLDIAAVNGNHGAAIYTLPFPHSNASRSNGHDTLNTNQLQTAAAKNMSNNATSERSSGAATPGILKAHCVNNNGDNMENSISINFNDSQYQSSSSSSTPPPSLATASFSNDSQSSCSSPSPMPDNNACPDCSPNPCNHMALTPTNPVQYGFSSQHQAVWQAGNGAPNCYPTHHSLMPQHPVWTSNTNGLVSPPASFAPYHFGIAPHNGYQHELTFHQNHAIPNLLNPAVAGHLMGMQLPQHQPYNTYPGRYGRHHRKTGPQQGSCSNCARPGHMTHECLEISIDSIAGGFRLNMKPNQDAVE